MSKIKLVILDADKTLYPIHGKRVRRRLADLLGRKHKMPPSIIFREFEVTVAQLKKSRQPQKRWPRTALAVLIRRLDLDEDLDRLKELYYTEALRAVRSFAGVGVALRALARTYKVVIASDEFSGFLKRKLNKALPGWQKSVKLLVTPEVTGTMKPSQKYYKIALKKFAVRPSEAVVVGDSWERDLRPAHTLGIKTVLVGKREGNPTKRIKSVAQLPHVLRDL